MNRIMLIGASGLLGTELRKLDESIISYTHDQMPIDKPIRNWFIPEDVEVIVNCAALKDNRKIEQDPTSALDTNIVGSVNIAKICIELGLRYVYISTDYVYEGSRGNYLETDPVLPCNLYAWTKLAGEVPAMAVKNHLIIRTSFGDSKFDYKVAFTDKWSSKDYVDRIAPLILEAAQSPLVGILNIGTERKTIYSLASERNQVQPVRLSETSHSTPYDTSLNLQKWMDYKSTKPIAKPHTNCRCCGSDQLVKYLDLGLMPLANNLETTSKAAKEKERYPLQVMFCEGCGLTQLSVVIDPSQMFSHYSYRSGINSGYITHCKKMAITLQNYLNLNENSFMIDIAGNDGTLLKQFRSQISGIKVINVDPASNLVAIAEMDGISSIADFWSLELADEIIKKHGHADLITATNVFAHVQNIKEFIQAAKKVLSSDGVLVIECPYLIDYITEKEYNQTYFEHLSTMSIRPVNQLCYQFNMKIIDVSKHDIHGGTVRIMIAKDESNHPIQESVIKFIDMEMQGGFADIKTYSKWGKDIKNTIIHISEKLLELKKQGKSIIGIGASAKGNTLLNASGINTDIIDAIIDDTPNKIGMYSPGTGIPIVQRRYLANNKPDYILILAENFKEKLMEIARAEGYKGKFIIALPDITIID